MHAPSLVPETDSTHLLPSDEVGACQAEDQKAEQKENPGFCHGRQIRCLREKLWRQRLQWQAVRELQEAGMRKEAGQGG